MALEELKAYGPHVAAGDMPQNTLCSVMLNGHSLGEELTLSRRHPSLCGLFAPKVEMGLASRWNSADNSRLLSSGASPGGGVQRTADGGGSLCVEFKETDEAPFPVQVFTIQ